MTNEAIGNSRRSFIKMAAAGAAAAATVNPLATSAAEEKPEAGKKMRVALAGLFEEVNTFAVETMGLATITGSMSTGFQKYEGQQIIDEFKGTSTQLGGYIDALNEVSAEIVPTVYYTFGAGPTIEGKAYQKMKKDVLAGLKAAMPLDAVALTVHGAGVAEGVDDVEGDLCAAIRQELGPKVKIVMAIDHHCNLTDFNREQVDLITIVKNYPHIDFYDVAFNAGKLLPDMVAGKITPHGHFEPLPFLMQCQSTMPGNLYAPIRIKAEEFAKRKGIYEFSYQYGFPFADIPFNTALVNCWAETPELASVTAKEFADWIWKNRAQFAARTLTAAEALETAADELVSEERIAVEVVRDAKARSSKVLYDQSIVHLANATAQNERSFGFIPDSKSKGPVVIAEKSDNPGAGAPGDSTHVLQELIKHNVKQACVCAIRDPETVRQAVKAGVGSTIDVKLGGKLSKQSGDPIGGKAYVKSISDGRYTIIGPMLTGMRFDMGPAVGLVIGGVDVAVISGMMQAFDNGQMRVVGFDPRDYRIVVVKSANHFRAWWTDIASAIIDCDPPGIASNNLSTFKFQRKTRKVYPLDADAVYPEAAA
ncbi:MAG TPA: M81 family metallopeptidase [Accumulibacter sp.]|uniref:M81 family metallopeptidase n=1 Tax=Accumulibacter sp. TaxID=2053492 RepID=UPI002B55BADC|nr:M81 family metallopeptidase [Accumulibacter sp.]HRD88199.1 M81 family metallopeptidase [Accumulibacter sp.]